ncbi:hypothetical protein GH714_024808 [Hevea brasiliensis]|uniref:Reverse transcriptase RNase H-like domain-containing protein n=1 Tax=Hevea brasiliensis TaxID=3981 RepID=A0A6A6NJ22_HEVBR|nr:hypothetical protein GH714_024808 [Hevea brasiliensis]
MLFVTTSGLNYTVMKLQIYHAMTLAREVEHALQISSAFSEPRRTSSPLGKMANSFGSSSKSFLGLGAKYQTHFTLTQFVSSVHKPTPVDKPLGSSLRPSTSSSPSSLTLTPPESLKGRNYRQYSNHELQDLRAKGLCFRCKLPYSPLHQCPNKSLHLLVVGEDDDLSSIGDLDSIDISASVSDSPMIIESHLATVLFLKNCLPLCSCKLRYSFVFTESSTLPPSQVTDHGIPLQAGVGPISIKPYRYGHYQKDEIERLVSEMTVTLLPFSHALSSHTLSNLAYEKELMALVLAIRHWRPYLLGQKFIVKTEQRSLKHILEQHIITPAQQCWVSKLLGFNLSQPHWLDFDVVSHAVQQDPDLQPIIAALQHDAHSRPLYSLIQQHLFYRGRLVIPSTSSWVHRLILEFNSTLIGGDHPVVTDLPATLAIDEPIPTLPETILAHKDFVQMVLQFTKYCLEDKAVLVAGGNDTHQMLVEGRGRAKREWKVYSRRLKDQENRWTVAAQQNEANI